VDGDQQDILAEDVPKGQARLKALPEVLIIRRRDPDLDLLRAGGNLSSAWLMFWMIFLYFSVSFIERLYHPRSPAYCAELRVESEAALAAD
jgi:hypothetical protein